MGAIGRFVCAVVIVASAVSLALADPLLAIVVKIDIDDVTFHPVKGSKKTEKAEKGPEQTLRLAPSAKQFKGGKLDERTRKFSGGEPITRQELSKLISDKEKGSFAAMLVEKDKDGKEVITELRILTKAAKK